LANFFSKLFGGKSDPEMEKELARLQARVKARGPLTDDVRARRKQLISAYCDAFVAGHHDEALRLAEELIEYDPACPFGWSNKVSALRALGRKAEARRTEKLAAKIVMD
jgi:tetratricopeptide (TPR) repeat protein